jgi:hypothetical protein
MAVAQRHNMLDENEDGGFTSTRADASVKFNLSVRGLKTLQNSCHPGFGTAGEPATLRWLEKRHDRLYIICMISNLRRSRSLRPRQPLPQTLAAETETLKSFSCPHRQNPALMADS